jgi:hypothetical protein
MLADWLRRLHEELSSLAERQVQGLEAVTGQIETLRRRIALRARTDQTLSPELIQVIADAIVERLSAAGSDRNRSRRSARHEDTPRR